MKKLLPIIFLGVFANFYANAQLTYNVTVPSGTYECYIAGDFQSPYPNWGQIKMDKVDDTHYTITLSNATTSQGYKYCSGPSWAYVENIGGNRTYTASDVVSSWAAVYNPGAVKKDITIKVKSPWASTYLYYWGDATVTWPGVLMSPINGSVVMQYTVPQVTTISIIFNNGGFGSGNQTGDITNISTDKCYQIESDASYSTADCSTLLTITEIKSTNKTDLILKSESSSLIVEMPGKINASLYTLQGAFVNSADFENTYTFSNLKSGMYLLKINGETFKALVK